ncbi:hypothetical protein [Streptomyces sp. KMM 9044]|uniref:hypothetical protein n=1 Tax=Streptomyces sp. KMM 9044 TaxID=2744474 RepID=UPI00215188F3|nr:hypothetical protein [Streptomyces sp. KMM 9044]WAX78198.1 hypothetical protein HUV60_011455 [Streptomyces sp. KMM 9044]
MTSPSDPPEGRAPRRRPQQQRKQVLLRLDPLVYEALARWANDELRSANAQIEFLLRRALTEVGRLPGEAGPLPRRGRPPAQSPSAPPQPPSEQPPPQPPPPQQPPEDPPAPR